MTTSISSDALKLRMDILNELYSSAIQNKDLKKNTKPFMIYNVEI